MTPSISNLRLSTVFGVTEGTVTPRTEFRSAKVRHLYEWWAGEAAGTTGDLPLRRRFDVVDHPPAILPHLFLAERLPDGGWLLKLHGEAVIGLFGQNNTGRVVTGASDAEVGVFGHALHEYYEEVAHTRVCRRCEGDLAHRDRGHVRFESIDCPLSRAGDRVDFIIGVIDRI